MPHIVDTSPSVTGREQVLLDPSDVATGRIELDITRWIAQAGPDWGDAAIEQYLAEAQRGQIPVDFRVPNRIVTIPLLLLDQTGATFSEMRRAVQAKAALFQREGGWLRRDTPTGGWYADVTGATLKLGGSTAQAMWGIDADAVLTLECLPDFYGAEVELTTHSTAGDAELVLVEDDIDGDYPARTRIVVTDDDSVARFGLLWGIRSRHYSNDSTAALAYEAEDLTPLDSAAVATVTGASGGASNNVVRHAALSAAAWTPVLSTEHAADGHLTHTGSYRVWVRAYTTSAAPPRLQLVWDTGEINAPAENSSVYVPAASAFYDVDLGEVRLDAAPVGAHQWQGQIQARGDDGGENVSIDKVWLVPVDEGYGLLRMSPSTLAGAISARDSFTGTTSGDALGTRTPDVGSAWATSGAATDFAFLDGGGGGGGIPMPPSEAVGRSASSASFRFAVLGSVMTDQQVAALFGASPATGDGTGYCGVIARWTNSSNYLRFTTVAGNLAGTPALGLIEVYKVVGGVEELILNQPLGIGFSAGYCSLQLAVTANGNVTAQLYSAAGALLQTLTGFDSDLATGGALATGKAGIIDSGNGSDTIQRWYDDVVVSSPAPEPVVINSGRSSELRSDGHYRQTSGGSGYDNINYIIGDLPRLPPSGMEERPVEIFVKASRGDFDQRADTGIDDITCQVYYRPSFLFVPDEPTGS